MDWDIQDGLGWTIFHRAAAFGQAKDLKKLLSLGASSRLYTFQLRWLPVSCAVNFGNESTFDFLIDMIPPQDLPSLVDTRGWNLLHLAAENGSEAIMTKVLKRRVFDLDATTDGSFAVPGNLTLQKLTAFEIARHYNHESAFVRAVNATSHVVPSPVQNTEVTTAAE